MECNYFEYKDMTEKMFYGVALTDDHLNSVTEQIRTYIVKGGAGPIVKKLGIGFKITEKQFGLCKELNEIVRCRFVWLNGEREGEELTINEICAIGMFLKYGPFYGKCGAGS